MTARRTASRSHKGGAIMGFSKRLVMDGVALVALGGAFGLGTVLAQQLMPPSKVTALMKQAIAEYPGHEVTMITLDIPPGGGSAAHRHPGHHTFGYVLEGAYRIKVEDGPEKVLHKGESFYEAPGQLHAVSRNASDTEPAKVLVLVLAESGKPLTVPEK
jgi:quercetin dioxygenase-like cupin family protein